ncbi:MAG: hypothetical protein EBV49_05360 [Betaproteobacteria bacterium]|nr:hypothetical protein [Betaproteobacteria bacterium]
MITMPRPNAYMTGFSAQACAGTALAASTRAQLSKLFAHRAGIGLLPASLQTWQDTLKTASTFEHRLLKRGFERVPWRIKAKAEFTGQCLELAKGRGIAPIPAGNGPGGKTQVGKLHHASGVEVGLDAQPVTAWAGACRVIKREEPRLELFKCMATLRAGKTV